MFGDCILEVRNVFHRREGNVRRNGRLRGGGDHIGEILSLSARKTVLSSAADVPDRHHSDSGRQRKGTDPPGDEPQRSGGRHRRDAVRSGGDLHGEESQRAAHLLPKADHLVRLHGSHPSGEIHPRKEDRGRKAAEAHRQYGRKISPPGGGSPVRRACRRAGDTARRCPGVH